MKGLIIFFAILVLLRLNMSSAGAQNYFIEDERPFTGGIVLGSNISKVDDADDFSSYHKIGFNTGGIIHINFRPEWHLGLEILYSQKGDRDIFQTSSAATGAYFSDYYLRLNYIETPVTLHYRHKKWDYEAGLSWSYLVGSFESINLDQPVLLDQNMYAFNKEDYEMIFGFSYNFYKSYNFNVRWQYSLSPIRPLDRMPLAYYAFDGQQNNVISFRLIYLFNNSQN